MNYGILPTNLNNLHKVNNLSETYRDINFDGRFDVSIVWFIKERKKAIYIRDPNCNWLKSEEVSDINDTLFANVDKDIYIFMEGEWIKEEK